MELILILAAFGGGVFGSLIGGTTAFIFTGLIGLVGIALSLAGAGDVMLNNIAFGPVFGPHVAFVGGVAAAALSGKKKRGLLQAGTKEALAEAEKHVDGADTITPLFKTVDPSVLLVGGIFGVLGLFVNHFYANILGLQMDTIAFTVLTMGIICRFIFGTTGLFGDKPQDVKRYDFDGNSLTFGFIWSLSLSAIIAYACQQLGINSIGFTISAISLIFIYFGLDFPVSHHVSMVTGFATIALGSVWMGMLFGVIAYFLGELVLRTFSSFADTHIDMPAVTIATLSFIILTVLS